MVLAADGRLLVDFGLRRAHGAEAGLLAARASYIAGFAGSATVLAGKEFGVPIYGTMAHSFVEAFANETAAFESFASGYGAGNEIGLAGGGGSSAMPHKANPVLAELLVTLARFNATQVAGIHHALVHEQERSGAAWMLEWMILPQMTMATGRALTAARSLCGQITQIGATD